MQVSFDRLLELIHQIQSISQIEKRLRIGLIQLDGLRVQSGRHRILPTVAQQYAQIVKRLRFVRVQLNGTLVVNSSLLVLICQV